MDHNGDHRQFRQTWSNPGVSDLNLLYDLIAGAIVGGTLMILSSQ